MVHLSKILLTLTALLWFSTILNAQEDVAADFDDEVEEPLRKEILPEHRMDGVVDLMTESFDGEFEGKPWLVWFYAPWNSWCHRVAPVYAELGKKLLNHPVLNLGKFDATSNPQIAAQYNVEEYPTFVLFRGPQPERAVPEDMEENYNSTVIYQGPYEVDSIIEFCRESLGHDI
eukprot:PhF_6_TR4986/c0_g1_i1/m.7059